MKNNTYYFSHDCNAHEDDKIIGLVMKCKWEGYGLYWLLNEIISQDPKIRIDKRALPKIAFRYNIDIALLENVITTCLDEKLYHTEDGEYIYSQRLRDHIAKRQEIRDKYSKAGKKGMKARWGNNDVIKSNNDVITSDNKRKEKKRKESKVYRTKPTLQEIKAYCILRKNNVNPDRFFNYYESNGWKVGKNPMKNWQAAVRTWESKEQGVAKHGLPALKPLG